jgi:prepilin-type N-terminal cleavage/methylation domain-containing protein
MADPRSQGRPKLRNPGFTLIEVLGAIAILGIWYVMLATLAMQGMQTVGESQRRLQASLLADEVLAEFELQTAQGQSIEVGSEERDEEPFSLEIEVIDISDDPGGEADSYDTLDDEDMGLLEFFASEEDSPFAEIRGGNWLLEYLREIRITVTWQEGAGERTIVRNSYLWDRDAWSNRDITLEEETDDESVPDETIGS